ncbi:MAG: redoxin domain-containing protein [Polyangiaceae bacterium]
MSDTFQKSRPLLRSATGLFMPAVLAATLAACGATTRPDGGEGLLPIGADAPNLAATDQHGKQHHLADEKGHPVVVYFYPKDNTPGCTKEACAFRDVWDKFSAANVQVLGVSTDDEKSHEAFAKEQKLPFPILADPNSEWVKAFGVPVRLGMASRVSFLIGADGKVAKVYPNVDPGIHADEVLKDATSAK